MAANPYAHLSVDELKKAIAEEEANLQKPENPYAHLSAEQLRKAIAEEEDKLARTTESTLSKTGRTVARTARNMAAGLMEIPDLLASPIRGALNIGAKAIGSDYEFKPVAEQVAHTIDTATGGYTKPTTKAEKIEEAVTRSLASLPVGGLAGKAITSMANPMAKAAGSFLRGASTATPTNVLGTAGASGLMQHSLNENPEDTLGALGMGVLGGLGGGALAGSPKMLTKLGRKELSEVAGEKVGKFAGIKPSAVEDFKRAGVNPLLADVVNNRIIKSTTHYMGETPFVGKSIQQAKEAQKESILNQLNLENALQRKEAGELVAKGAKAYQESKNTIHSPLFERFEADLEKLPDTNISLSKTSSYIEKLLKTNKNGLMDKKFLKTPAGKMINELKQEASIYNGEVPYESLKQTLELINDKITTHGLIGKVSQGRLKKLAEVISDDMENSLEHKFKELGTDAYSNWKEAKNLYREYATHDIPNLNEIFKKDKKGAVSVFEDLVNNTKVGDAKFKLALEHLSHSEQEALINAYQKRLGSQGDGSFSIAKWGTEFSKLGKDSQDVSLFALNKHAREKVHAIADVVDHMKDTLKEANSSKTAYHMTLGAIALQASKIAGAAAVGNFYPAGGALTGLILGKIGANALSNPKLINWAYKGMRSKDLSHYMRNLKRIDHVSGIHKSIKTEVQRFVNDINEAQGKE